MHRFHRSRLPLLVAALAVLVVLPSLAGPVDAATKRGRASATTSVRTEPRTTAKVVLTSLDEGARVTAVKTVRAGKWSARCGGSLESRKWLKIVAINGKSTESLFGRNAVFAAKWLFKFVKHVEPDPDPTPDRPRPRAGAHHAPTTISNCPVRLRDDASTTPRRRRSSTRTRSSRAPATSTAAAGRPSAARTSPGDSWLEVTRGRRPERRLALRRRASVYAASGLFQEVTPSDYREGIDVSHWQGNIDWVQVAGAGKSFAIDKATEGVGYKDDKYDRNKAGAMAQRPEVRGLPLRRPGERPGRARRTGSSTTRTTSTGCSSRRSTSSGPAAAARPG